MGAMLDYIASAVIFGVLVLSVARVQTNINSSMYQNTFSIGTQQKAVELARQIEYDFLKIGHHVRGQRILGADDQDVTFRADLLDNWDTSLVRLAATSTSNMTETPNVDDFPLIRVVDGQTVVQKWGLVGFRIQYFDSNMTMLGTPITNSDSLARIRGIDVRFTVQSPEPVIDGNGDTSWSTITWEKLMFPRNLYQINLTR